MNPHLLRYYNRELQHLREMGGEFAREFPKIASRLTLDGFECADPYVERLLEGFAFLAARVQLKLDAEFPRFTQHLLEMVYPHYLAPTPSMAMVRFQPDLTEGALAEGFVVPRHTVLRSVLGKGEQTPCEYRTAHDVTLWPLELVKAEYFSAGREAMLLDELGVKGAKSGVLLKLRTTAGLTFDRITLDRLQFFIRGTGEIPGRIYEQLMLDPVAVLVRPAEYPVPWCEVVPAKEISRVGFDDDQSLLPAGPRSFHGYRLLHEYFAFPERFLIVELGGLRTAAGRTEGRELEILVLFKRSDPMLEGAVDESHFSLFCTPAINLFPRRADRIHLTEQRSEHHIVPDRTRPMDFEVYEVLEVTGHGTSADEEVRFLPFYATNDITREAQGAFYTTRREPRVLSSKQRRYGPRSSYVGSEVHVSLVDARCAPYDTNLRQLSLELYCTNRDLPLQMPVGQTATDFTLQTAAPVESVRALAGPTKPRASYAEGDASWRLISHLSLNYLSLTDTDRRKGAEAVRELLSLYGAAEDPNIQKQIESVRSVASKPIIRRIPIKGPAVFGRGLEVTVTFDEREFGGTGFSLLGAVLERFFAKYVSTNSFTETVLRTIDRGEVKRWPVRIGHRHMV